MGESQPFYSVLPQGIETIILAQQPANVPHGGHSYNSNRLAQKNHFFWASQ
jgi:hypothetical protein